jgi:hypothetical protein
VTDNLNVGEIVRIVVAGLYNSGSSCMAGILHHLGVDMGAPFYEFPENEDEMFYEPEDMSADLRRMWKEPDGETDLSSIERQEVFRKWIQNRETIHKTRAHHGAKHPLLCLSLNDIVSAWGDETVFIWSRRDLEKSIEGLKRRHRKETNQPCFSAEAAEALQRKLYRHLENFFRFLDTDQNRIAIEYSDVTAHKVAAVDYIIKTLKLNITDEPRLKAIASIHS